MLFLTNFVFTSCNLQNHAIVSWIILGARFDRGSPQNLVYIKHYCQLAGCRFKWKGESDISFHRCHSHGDCHPWFPPGCLTGFFIRGCASTAQAWHYDNHRRKWVTGHGNCWKLLKMSILLFFPCAQANDLTKTGFTCSPQYFLIDSLVRSTSPVKRSRWQLFWSGERSVWGCRLQGTSIWCEDFQWSWRSIPRWIQRTFEDGNVAFCLNFRHFWLVFFGS